jgi:hypothetical protein
MQRPFAVTILSWLFIAAGAVGLVYHAVGFRAGDPLADVILVLVVRALAIWGGIFALRGANWARWLLVAWMAYHVVISWGHSTSEVASHAILLLVTAIVYFRAPGSAWFRRGLVSGV